MADTARLLLPTIQASQAQKHVTHNDALRLLDGMVQASVINSTRTAPPASPGAGDCYIVAAGASGVWAGWDGDIALYADGAWYRLVVGEGWRAFDQAQGAVLVRIGASWVSLGVAVSANGSFTRTGVLEDTLTGLSGATASASIYIPNRAICIGVSTRTVTSITGATSYDCGTPGEADKFGGTLGIAAGSTSKGVIGPQAFYADTPVVLTANGGSFTGGAVRLAIHYIEVGVPDA